MFKNKHAIRRVQTKFYVAIMLNNSYNFNFKTYYFDLRIE